MVKGPLEGLKVLDLSRQLAGPFCTMNLGDLGAEVIKIEMPGRGDDSRHWGPFWNEESTYYLSINRNKKSVELDLKDENDKQIFLDLVKESDIVIQNFRHGKIEAMGLGYETLREINKGIIFCSITGYGSKGELKDRVGLDLALQAFSGMMGITGYENDPPVRVGISIADIACGFYALSGILAALNYRNKTGIGQKVEVSLLESIISMLNYHAVGYFATGEVPKREGSGLSSRMVPYQAYKAKDQYMIIGIGNDNTWKRFINAIDDERLKNELYLKNAERVKHVDTINQIISEILITNTAEYWVELLSENGIPASVAGNIDYALEHPQTKELDMVVEVEHPKIPNLKLLGIPMNFSETPGTIRLHPPTLGENNHEFLKEKKEAKI